MTESKALVKLLTIARDINKQIGGKELAHIPTQYAQLIVRLKAAIQDLDAETKSNE